MPPKKKRKNEFIKAEWKGRHFNKKKKQNRERSERVRDDSEQGAGYKIIAKENDLFVKYYQGIGLIPLEEWDIFMATMKESLPATFRITGTRLLAQQVRTCLEKMFFKNFSQIEVEGEKVPPPKPLTWYPDNLAWHVPLTKKFIRKSPLMSKFHCFLVRENEQGNISRQEAVSMIPPLLLDVKAHYKVLDMCAAPGSKTAQLIEALHEGTENSAMPEGVVIANDADNKRCYMLVHQAKRLNSPCFMVTNHDASVFPMFYYHDKEDVRHPLHYDRVLCDVPCSGDGTLRKNPTIWRQWNPSVGQSLHKLQLRILTRGLELLIPGGRLVYSTCSLNPVENEAVIATMLGLCKGSVELVDCGDCLPGLKLIPGVMDWKVMNKEGEWVTGNEASKSRISSTMFPPRPECKELTKCMRVLPHHQDTGGFFITLIEKKDWLPWQKERKKELPVSPLSSKTSEFCVPSNIISSSDIPQVTPCDKPVQEAATSGLVSLPLPPDIIQETSSNGSSLDKESVGQTQDSSQIQDEKLVPSDDSCVLRKEVKEEKMEEERPSDSVIGRPAFQQRRSRGYKEDPYVFLQRDSDVHQAIDSYYGTPESFPYEQLLTRSFVGRKRNVYLTSRLVKELTIRNEHVVKIINIGVRVLARYDHQRTTCTFRICQEGVDTMLPYITNHTVPVSQDDLVCLLAQPNPLISTLSQTAQESLHPLGVGPVLFKFSPPDKDIDHADDNLSDSNSEGYSLSCPISLSGWVAAKSARLFVDKNYRYHFLTMLGHDAPENQSLENVTAASHGMQERDEKGVSDSIMQCDNVDGVETAFRLNDGFEFGVKSGSEKSESKTDEGGGLESEPECMVTI